MPNNTLSLPKIQRWLKKTITYASGFEELFSKDSPIPNNSQWAKTIKTIQETPTLNRSKRIGIYNTAYFYRLIDCMGANYPTIRNILGPEHFSKLARSYLLKYPSTGPIIDNVGHKLSAFVSRGKISHEFPFFSDLAILEWNYHETFYADDAPPFDSSKLSLLTQEKLAQALIKIDSSVKMLNLLWPVDQIWWEDGVLPKNKITKIKKKNISLLIFRRPDKLVRVRRMSLLEQSVLKDLMKGKPLGYVLRRHRNNLIPSQLEKWFQYWSINGIICDINSN